jgi:hypothetical protein
MKQVRFVLCRMTRIKEKNPTSTVELSTPQLGWPVRDSYIPNLYGYECKFKGNKVTPSLPFVPLMTFIHVHETPLYSHSVKRDQTETY